MKFYPVLESSLPEDSLKEEYQNAHAVGALRLGESNAFIRMRFKTYYIPYEKIDRCYRRVMLVPAKMCCANGELQVESIVFENEGKELAVVELPGQKAAKIAFSECQKKMPHAEFSCPKKEPQE